LNDFGVWLAMSRELSDSWPYYIGNNVRLVWSKVYRNPCDLTPLSHDIFTIICSELSIVFQAMTANPTFRDLRFGGVDSNFLWLQLIHFLLMVRRGWFAAFDHNSEFNRFGKLTFPVFYLNCSQEGLRRLWSTNSGYHTGFHKHVSYAGQHIFSFWLSFRAPVCA